MKRAKMIFNDFTKVTEVAEEIDKHQFFQMSEFEVRPCISFSLRSNDIKYRIHLSIVQSRL